MTISVDKIQFAHGSSKILSFVGSPVPFFNVHIESLMVGYVFTVANR